jgi:2-polyprenyl-6-methoxyphenol hydroxylase-like FAD-dependent oxidoreductase
MSNILSGKRIAVSGAGMAGLSFAIAVRKNCLSNPPPELVIFERDTEEDSIIRQGYSLSLRTDPPGGLQALKKLGLLDATLAASVVSNTGDGDSGISMWDNQMRRIIQVHAEAPPDMPVGGSRIARSRLREILVQGAADAGYPVRWGVACNGVERRQDGRLGLMLSNGENDVCDLLIAADGASSKLRSQLRPDDGLTYQGISCIGATSRFDGLPPAPVNRDWGMVISGTGTGLFVSPVDDHSALWNLSWYADAPIASKKQGMPQADADALLAEARARVPEFPPLFEELVEHTDPATLMAFAARDKPPFVHDNTEFPEVIFIGDANHAVSPFAGNGANMALSDGWDLAETLCKEKGGPLRERVAAYDGLVVPRSKKVLKMSHFNMNLTHVKGWRVWVYLTLIRMMAFLFMPRLKVKNGAK